MNPLTDNQIAEIKLKISELEKNLYDFIKEDEYTKQHNTKPNYNGNHISKCIKILTECMLNVRHSKSTQTVKRKIYFAVLKLNILYISTRFGMIETMEREDIAEILNLIGFYTGAIEKDVDLTEKLRIW